MTTTFELTTNGFLVLLLRERSSSQWSDRRSIVATSQVRIITLRNRLMLSE